MGSGVCQFMLLPSVNISRLSDLQMSEMTMESAWMSVIVLSLLAPIIWISPSMQLHYRMHVLFSYIASWPHQIQDYTFYGLWHAVLFTIPMCLLLPWYSLSLVKQMQYIFINLISLKFIVNITQHRPVLIQKSHTNTVTFILAPHWWLLYPNIPP